MEENTFTKECPNIIPNSKFNLSRISNIIFGNSVNIDLICFRKKFQKKSLYKKVKVSLKKSESKGYEILKFQIEVFSLLYKIRFFCSLLNRQKKVTLSIF